MNLYRAFRLSLTIFVMAAYTAGWSQPDPSSDPVGTPIHDPVVPKDTTDVMPDTTQLAADTVVTNDTTRWYTPVVEKVRHLFPQLIDPTEDLSVPLAENLPPVTQDVSSAVQQLQGVTVPGAKGVLQTNVEEHIPVDRVGDVVDKYQVPLSPPDSATVERWAQTAEKRAEEEVLKRTALPADGTAADPRQHMQQALAGYMGQSVNKLQTRQQVFQQVQTRVDQLGGDYDKVIGEAREASEKALQKAKRRLTDLPSERLRESGNPLQHKPLRERLTFGGNISLRPGEITRLNLSPEVTYRLYPRWSVGLGVSYQLDAVINEKEQSLTDGDEGASLRSFSQYALFGGFLAHAEYDRVIFPSHAKGGAARPDKALLGVAKLFNLDRRVVAQTQMLYNLSYDRFTPGSQRWEYRVSFSIRPKNKNDKHE